MTGDFHRLHGSIIELQGADDPIAARRHAYPLELHPSATNALD